LLAGALGSAGGVSTETVSVDGVGTSLLGGSSSTKIEKLIKSQLLFMIIYLLVENHL